MMPPPLSHRRNPSQEEFVKTQQQAHGANLLRAGGGCKRGGEMAAPHTGGLLVAPYAMKPADGNAVGSAKRGGEYRGSKDGGRAFDGGLLGQFHHEQNEQRLAEQKLRSPSRRGPHAPCTCTTCCTDACTCTACTPLMHAMVAPCTGHAPRAYAHAHALHVLRECVSQRTSMHIPGPEATTSSPASLRWKRERARQATRSQRRSPPRSTT